MEKEEITNSTRFIVASFLNKDMKEQEMLEIFDLKKCECGHYELEEDMVYNKWDLGGYEDKVCEGCRNDQSI